MELSLEIDVVEERRIENRVAGEEEGRVNRGRASEDQQVGLYCRTSKPRVTHFKDSHPTGKGQIGGNAYQHSLTRFGHFPSLSAKSPKPISLSLPALNLESKHPTANESGELVACF
ncbi:hypothetical protein SLE2022_295770 [Rubroshorea leprosula]